ncbi:Formin-binding protein 1 [Geranomyces michiganensis]|nr:Formin-binding protein 1 [Geranomyces michiganensis]
MTANPETAFGRTLWDQWESVEQYTSVGTKSLERFNDFLKARSEIEAKYARELQKLAKTQKDEAVVAAKPKEKGGFNMAVMSGTVAQSWLQLLTVTEHTAAFHTSLAEQLDGEMRKSIKTQIKDNGNMFKQQFEEIRKAKEEYRKQVEHLEKTRQKYDKATKDMDAARQAYESANQDMNKTAKDIEKLRSDAEKKAIIAQDAASVYRECIDQTNAAKLKHFEETLPNILDDIQNKDEQNRIEFTRKAFLRYADLLNAQTPSITSSIDAMVSIFSKITPAYDSATFVKLCRSNASHPPDFQFEERALYTPGGGALSPSATLGAGGSSMSAVGKKGSLTRGFTKSDLADESKEEAIVSLGTGSKAGRKKAVERIKALEKELAENEKKRTGCETLISVYKSKPEISQDPKVARDLDDQINAVEARIAAIVARRQKLVSYVAAIDGTTILPDGSPLGNSPLVFSPDSVASFRSAEVHAAGGGSYGSAYGEDDGRGGTEMDSTDDGGGGVEIAIGRARMVYDYEGAPGDLSVAAGEEIEVLDKQEDGWWKARVTRTEGVVEGFVPGNYTEEI